MNKFYFDLQLFATQTQTTESAGLSKEMKDYYEKRLIDVTGPKLVHDQFADKYPIPKNGGKTIEFRRYSPLAKALTPIKEGVTPDGNKLDVTSYTATVSQYGDWIQMSDMLELTAIDNNVVQATKLLGSQAGRTLDTVTREVLVGGTNVIYAPKVAADGTKTEVTSRAALNKTAKLDVDLIFRAARQLKAMNANKIDDSYVAIIHPDVAYDLMRSEGWMDVYKYATPENIYDGEIGKLGGVRFVESTEAKIWTNDGLENETNGESDPIPPFNDDHKDSKARTACPEGLAVYATLVLGANAYGTTEITGGGLQHIVRPVGYGEDPLNQRSSCGWKCTKVSKRLVEEYMVRIESCSSFSDTALAN